MNGAGFDLALSKWFDFKIPAPSIPPHFILQEIEKNPEKRPTATSQLIWMGTKPECNVVKKKELEIGQLSLVTKSDEDTLVFDLKIAQWLNHTLIGLMPSAHYQKTTFQDFVNDFKSHQLGDFEQFYKSASMEKLKELGLLVI